MADSELARLRAERLEQLKAAQGGAFVDIRSIVDMRDTPSHSREEREQLVRFDARDIPLRPEMECVCACAFGG